MHMHNERERKSGHVKVTFSSSPTPTPFTLAVNKSPAVYIYHARFAHAIYPGRIALHLLLQAQFFFFFLHPYPLVLAVNKSPAVYIYHARLHMPFTQDVAGTQSGDNRGYFCCFSLCRRANKNFEPCFSSPEPLIQCL